jgi:uncharacterized protein (TIRG00374 family)
MKESRPRGLKNIVFIAIGIIIILLLLLKIGLAEFYENLINADHTFTILSLAVFSLAVALKGIRWHSLFGETGLKNDIKIYLIGQSVNQIAPTGSGELTRAYVARNKFGINVGKTLAPAAIERFLDTAFLLSMTIIYIFLIVSPGEYLYQMAIAIIIGTIAVIIILYIIIRPQILDRPVSFFGRLFEKEDSIFNRLSSKVTRSVGVFQKTLLSFHEKKMLLLKNLILTIMIWSLFGLGSYLALKAFGEEVLFLYMIPIVCASEIIGAFSFIPGGLGVKEETFAIFLSFLGVAISIGETAALIIRGIGYLIVIFGAGISLFTMRKIRSVDRSSDK